MTTFKRDRWEDSFLENLAHLGLTMMIVFVLLLLSAFPFKLGGFGEIRPAFLLMAVYYWSIFRPRMMLPVGTFLSGIILDLLAGMPLGLNTLTLLVVQILTRGQRKFMQSQRFAVIWIGFHMVALGAALLQWAIYSLFEWHWMPMKPLLISAIMTGLIFPLAVLPLYAINRAVDRHRASA
jgi:rod shape-determining protein MreD